jgi:RNA polymerase sigma factor (sigma-70 family)
MSDSPERPTTFMRAVVALLLAALVAVGLVPIAVVGAIVFVALVAILTAYGLGNTGGLEPITFHAAHILGFTALGFTLVIALLVRRLTQSPTSTFAKAAHAATRRPLVAVALLLAMTSLVLVKASWGTQALLAPAALIVDAYVVALGGLGLGVVSCALATLATYRWSTASRYRAGMATGGMVTLLIPLVAASVLGGVFGFLPNPPALQNARRTFTEAPSTLEGERQVLVSIDNTIEGRTPPPPVTTPPVPPPTTPPPPTPRPQPSPAPQDNRVNECLALLAGEQAQVCATLKRQLGLSEDDAHDVVLDTMLKLCTRHAEQRYGNLGGLLTVAAKNRAKDYRRKRRTECGVDTEIPSCAAPTDDNARLASEMDTLNQAFCSLDKLARNAIDMHYIDERPYLEVGPALGLTPDQAKDVANNGIKKMRALFRQKCML